MGLVSGGFVINVARLGWKHHQFHIVIQLYSYTVIHKQAKEGNCTILPWSEVLVCKLETGVISQSLSGR